MPMKLKAFKAEPKVIEKYEIAARRFYKGNLSKMIRDALDYFIDFKKDEATKNRLLKKRIEKF